MIRLFLLLLLATGGPANGQQSGWTAAQYDPGASAGAPADMVLPMPCGGAMAFQKVSVPLDAADPIADRRLRLGQSLESTGYADYLITGYLRGAFTDAPNETHFYIARYELTRGQFRALQGDCRPPERIDRTARGGLSWFDAVTLAQNYSAWLYTNAKDSLPVSGSARGYVRLPTEAEWEYAARGGAAVDANRFHELRYISDDTLREHAFYQGGGARGRLGPVGLRKPNPLGLFDVYGNAEELMLEPFRMNVLGRLHGQSGGVVTRGGSVLSTADQLYSAQRTEYPPLDPDTGRPLRGDTFGLRLAIGAHVATSEARLRDIQARWAELAVGAAEESADPERLLTALIEAEADPGRQKALTDLQLELRRSRDQTQFAMRQSVRATYLSGAAFVEALSDLAAEIDAKAAGMRMLVELQRAGRGSAMLDRQLEAHVRDIGELRRRQQVYLLSYRAALETLSADFDRADRDRVRGLLIEELGLSGQSGLRRSLTGFAEDLERFSAAPDMDAGQLLGLALD